MGSTRDLRLVMRDFWLILDHLLDAYMAYFHSAPFRRPHFRTCFTQYSCVEFEF